MSLGGGSCNKDLVLVVSFSIFFGSSGYAMGNGSDGFVRVCVSDSVMKQGGV